MHSQVNFILMSFMYMYMLSLVYKSLFLTVLYFMRIFFIEFCTSCSCKRCMYSGVSNFQTSVFYDECNFSVHYFS